MNYSSLLRQLLKSRWVSLTIGVIVLAVWGLFLRDQLVALQGYSWQIGPVPLLLAIMWAALYFGGLAVCWALLLRRIVDSSAPVPLLAATRLWLYSMSTRYIPGNVWHIVSRIALAQQFSVSASSVLTSATIEQLLVLLAALLLFGLTLPFWGVIPLAHTLLLVLIPIGLLLLHPRVLGGVLGWLATRLRRPELVWEYRYREILVLLGAYTGATFCAGLALYMVLWGLTPVQMEQLPLAVGAAALAWVVGYLSFFTPSGLGIREAVLVAVLATTYPLPVAIVGSLLFRLVVTLGELLTVGFAWMHGRMSKEAVGGA